MVNVNVERIIAEVSGTGDAALGSHQSSPALTDGSDASRYSSTHTNSTHTDSTHTDETGGDTISPTVDGEFDGPEATVREEDDD
jgi:hypothetical protein